MLTVILAYTIVLGNTTLPKLEIEMVSPAACGIAAATMLNSAINESIKVNGGSLEVTCKVEVK